MFYIILCIIMFIAYIVIFDTSVEKNDPQYETVDLECENLKKQIADNIKCSYDCVVKE